MLEDTLREALSGSPGSRDIEQNSLPARQRWPVGVALSALGLVACFLLSVTPLMRMPDSVLRLHLPPGAFLARVSGWLPLNLGALPTGVSAYGEFSCLLVLAFLCYGCGSLMLRRWTDKQSQRTIRNIILLGALVAGAICVVTPAMLSHDILVYASYSRVLAAYHANPYFVPIASFPQDPFASLNYWSGAVSAYGPLWMLVCGFAGWLLKPDPGVYVVAFRLFALAVHLLNIWLVGRALQAMGRSSRTVTLGMLLYAWNPLLLLESGLGGHNDNFMLTFVLVAILLAAGTEKRGQTLRPRGYLPVVVALTLAVLVKFTALPVLAAYLIFLACKALRPSAASPREFRQALRNWRPALFVLLWSGIACVLAALALYGPFWFGHSLKDIVASFRNPPSALYAENSFMRSVAEWQRYHPALHNALLGLLSNRRFWDDLTLLGIAVCLCIGARTLWWKPTTRMFVVVSLLVMSVVLLITPWFFAWYITWILGLGIVCLPARLNRVEAALLALTFTFSFSALITYLFNGNLFGSHYYLVSLFTTVPPACAFLLTLVLWRPTHFQTLGDLKR